MASISKRSGSYRAQVRVDNSRKTATFRTRAEALAWIVTTESEMRKSRAGGGEGHTLLEALRRYAEEESPKKRGCLWERTRLRKFERSLPFVGKPLPEIQSSAIASWRDAQSTSPGTVRREMVLLQSVFEVAVREWGWLVSNPMKSVKKPSSPRPRDRIFTDDEIERICERLTGPKGSQVRAAFLISLETAMRSGEILTLEWSQVDLKARVVRLRKSKNGDRRDVPLSARAVALFESLPVRSKSLFDCSSASRDSLFRKAKRLAGVEGVTFHDARATALTRLSRKVDVLTLARISGHRDLKSLQAYYRESAAEIAKRL